LNLDFAAKLEKCFIQDFHYAQFGKYAFADEAQLYIKMAGRLQALAVAVGSGIGFSSAL
jgi:hypothetical protein